MYRTYSVAENIQRNNVQIEIARRRGIRSDGIMAGHPHHYILLKYDIISNEIMDQVYYNFEDSDLWSEFVSSKPKIQLRRGFEIM